MSREKRRPGTRLSNRRSTLRNLAIVPAAAVAANPELNKVVPPATYRRLGGRLGHGRHFDAGREESGKAPPPSAGYVRQGRFLAPNTCPHAQHLHALSRHRATAHAPASPPA